MDQGPRQRGLLRGRLPRGDLGPGGLTAWKGQRSVLSHSWLISDLSGVSHLYGLLTSDPL